MAVPLHINLFTSIVCQWETAYTKYKNKWCSYIVQIKRTDHHIRIWCKLSLALTKAMTGHGEGIWGEQREHTFFLVFSFRADNFQQNGWLPRKQKQAKCTPALLCFDMLRLWIRVPEFDKMNKERNIYVTDAYALLGKDFQNVSSKRNPLCHFGMDGLCEIFTNAQKTCHW